MDCSNHAAVTAVSNCAACAEPFCANCLVTVKSAPYCAACKWTAVGPLAASPVRMCEEASVALKYALFGIVCLGIFLAPLAISKAAAARKAIAADPSLGGKGKADAALVIAFAVLGLWVVGLLGRVKA